MPAPAPHTDAMIRRLESEIEERNQLIQGLAQDAQSANNGAGRDLETGEREQINRARTRINELVEQLEPLRESSRIALEARQRSEVINAEIERMRGRGNTPGNVEYRSAGEYIADLYLARMGDHEAGNRVEVFHRAAAHQTTADNPGLLPESIVEPVINLVDNARPLVSALGPRDLGTGSWAYARVTQHTQVGVQSAEKAELPSRKMTITKTPITAPTLGGYVNVSRQDISRTSPGILDMVISDLASEYSIESEEAAAAVLLAAGTAYTGTWPAAGAGFTPYAVSQVVWGAVAQSYTAMRGQGRSIVAVSPDMLGVVGPLFGLINPQNAYGSGFSAAAFGQGAQGQISNIGVVMSAALPAGTVMVVNSAAVRVFEMRYGALQVVEPSVWGVQVGYAGDFQTIVIEAAGIVEVDTTP